MKRIFVVGALVLGMAAPAVAANPPGSGQPGQECGESGAEQSPPGFDSGGFSNAESHYAGSDGTPSAANGSSKAVSQYDVACFQVSHR
jgi:hypothetical protein